MNVPSQATSSFARMIEEEVVVIMKVKQMKKTYHPIAMATIKS